MGQFPFIMPFLLLLLSVSLSFAEIVDPYSQLSSSARLRLEKKLFELETQVKEPVKVLLDAPLSPITKASEKILQCETSRRVCGLLGRGIEESLREDVADVSSRAFGAFGVAGAAERSLFILSKTLSTNRPPPWRRISLGSFLFDQETVPPRDNLQVGEFMSEYVTETLRHQKIFPNWFYTQGGGVWFEPFHINFHLTAPYRVLGYLLAVMTPLSKIQVYKFSILFIGLPIFLLGVYLLAHTLFLSHVSALLTTALCLFSSVCFSFIHNEQILSTMIYVPYLWLCLVKLKNTPRLIFPIVAMTGLGLTVHYPHMLFGYFLILFLSAIVGYANLRVEINATLTSLRKFLSLKKGALLFFVFLVSLSPSLYAYLKLGKSLHSPFRGTEVLRGMPYEEYSKKFQGSIQGLDKSVYGLYAGLTSPSDIRHEDLRIIFWNTLAPISLILLLFVSFKGKWFQLSALILSALFSLGAQAFVPRVLLVVFPFFSMFRVWGFFVVFFNLHMIFLMVYTLREFFKKYAYFRKTILLLMALLGVGSSFHWLYDSWRFYVPVLQRNNIDYYSLNGETGYTYQTWFDENLVYKGAAEYFVPEDFNINKVKALAQQSPLHWVMADGSLQPVQGIENSIRPLKGGFHFDLPLAPPGMVGVNLHQFNDGNWRAEDGAGKEIPIESSSLKTIVLKWDSSANGITLHRGFSLFSYLFFAMWVPLFLCLAYELAVKLRKSLVPQKIMVLKTA